MTSIQLREQLHNYINRAEQKKLKALYTIIENEITETPSMLSAAQKTELDFRLEEYLQGKGKNYSWNEAVKQITTTSKKK
jgi:hypothetical protein